MADEDELRCFPKRAAAELCDTLSGRHRTADGVALRARARHPVAFVDGDDAVSFCDIGFPLATGRAMVPHRGVALGRDQAELVGAVSDDELYELLEDGLGLS